MKKIFVLLMYLSFFLTACVAPRYLVDSEVALRQAQDILVTMTLEEKIAQLFIVRPESLDPQSIESGGKNVSNAGVLSIDESWITILEEYPVGGIVLFSRNLEDPTQLSALTKSFQKYSKTPLFIGIDEEGGRVARVGNADNFSVKKIGPMQDIGLTNDFDKAKKAGYTIGNYLKKYGINLNFAPVADINTNPHNTVVGDRAFGNNPLLVSEMVVANIEGFHKAGIITSTKHFPGHGDTHADTHNGFVSIHKTWDELLAVELIPFVNSFDETDMVMVSHVSAPKITGNALPSSLSYTIIQEKLRDELGYDGIVITDALDMRAITNEYTSGGMALRALNAGVDIILMPNNFIAAYDAILWEVENNRIPESRIDESVLKILTLKCRYNIL